MSNSSNTNSIMFIKKMPRNIIKFALLSLSALSFNAWSFICQPADTYGYEGYDESYLYNGYYLYNVRNNNYQSYSIVQQEAGAVAQEFWCLYQSESEKTNHITSCEQLATDPRPVCRSLNIGGFVEFVTNIQPYADPLIVGDCLEENLCLDIPQTLLIKNYEDSDEQIELYTDNGHVAGFFGVYSNGWVDFSFSGTSLDATGVEVNTPYFYKPDLDARGIPIAGRYDTLDATLGVRVSNAELLKQIIDTSTNSYDSWKLNSDVYGIEAVQPAGTTEDFILPFTDSKSPGYAIGAFSPQANFNEEPALIKVYARAAGGYAQQSGIYDMNIVLTVTAHEQ